MFKTRKPIRNNQFFFDQKPNKFDQRTDFCRRVLHDKKYFEMSKNINRRKDVRRHADLFDDEEYQRLC